jgi:hypothetical protein
MSFASFKGARKLQSRRQWSNKCVKCIGGRLGTCLRHYSGLLEKTQAFPKFNDFISLRHHWGVFIDGSPHKFEISLHTSMNSHKRQVLWTGFLSSLRLCWLYRLDKIWGIRDFTIGARGSVVGWCTMLQTGRSPVRVPDKVNFFNPSNRTMALGSTQPLTEMSTRNHPGG